VVFGPAGIWNGLVRRTEGFIRSEVICEAPDERRYRVRDFWTSHFEFEFFRRRFQAEYGKFDQWLLADGLVEKQQLVGAYYEDDSSGDELIPA
jgi:hypothetical protein